MKKSILLITMTLPMLIASAAQDSFFRSVTFRGAFSATGDWTAGWANFDPQNVAYPATNATLSGEITSDMTLDKTKVYKIVGNVYVRNGATLTIPAGTILRGDKATKATIIVTKGSKIMAIGTVSEPIIFTSNEAVGDRDYGDWGGIIILGAAPVNVAGGTATIEGGINNANNDGIYGGTNVDDNSGILTYLRAEFGGIAYQPNNEINGITFGGVGRGTKLSYLQVSYSGDDSYEWFGGNVDADHLICHRGWDDDLDCDFGYTGRIQFALILRDPLIADVSGSNGWECDNDGTGSDASPFTAPVFSNITLVGPLANSSTPNSNYKRALHLRRNSRVSVFNSVIIGYPTGLLLDGTKTLNAFIGGTAEFKNNVISCCTKPLDTVAVVGASFNIATWFATGGFGNSIVTACGDIMIGSYSLTAPNLLPQAGSPLLSGADFSSAKLGPNKPASIVENKNYSTSVYPNPATNVVNVNFDNEISGDVVINLFSNTGALISSQTVKVGGQSTIELPIETLASGIYFVKLSSENFAATHKIAVQ